VQEKFSSSIMMMMMMMMITAKATDILKKGFVLDVQFIWNTQSKSWGNNNLLESYEEWRYQVQNIYITVGVH
jgi:hypothetical protein